MGPALALILALSALPRFAAIGRQSFWYDEVVSLRLALAPSPSATVRLLREIDATRAPLHPLLLRGWVRAFGTSESAARSLSATCGLLTVLVAFAIGRRVGGPATGLWSASFAGASPLLLEYSVEARMYALLTLLASLAWWNLLGFRDRCTTGRMALQVALMVAMIYAHPLALLMMVALGLGWLSDRGRTRLGLRSWVLVQVATCALVAPWVPLYFDHPPEFTSGRLPIRFLLGLPIGFTGGDSRSLLVFSALAALGFWPRPIRFLTRHPKPATAWPLAAWLAVPPALLYAYSWVGHPIFGPSRYNVFVAPAYLILVARGIASLGRFAAAVAGLGLLSLAVVSGLTAIGAEGKVKADWRRAAEILDRRAPGAPVVVISPTPGRNFEVEVARYYLGPSRRVVPMLGAEADLIASSAGGAGEIVFTASLKGRAALGAVPESLRAGRPDVSTRDVTGLRLYFVPQARRQP